MRFLRRRRDRDIAEEVNAHLALLEDEYRHAGLTAAEAHDAARRALGGELKTRQAYAEQGGLHLVDSFVQDARFAIRTLWRDRSFALTATLVLGIGIGVNNMMFTLIYGSTLRGLPIDRANRVLYVSTFDQRFPDRPLSFQDFEDLRSGARSFIGLGAFVGMPLSVGDQGRVPERLDGAYTSAGALDVIGRPPLLGRTFAADEDVPGAAPVAVLSRAAWHSRYGGDAGILGRSILVNGSPATVIGVMPDRSGFPSTAEIWLPLAHAPNLPRQQREARTLRVFGRMRDEVQLADARAEVEAIVARIAREHPDTSAGLAARVVPIDERFFGGLNNPNWRPFIAASLLVLIVSCANAANLMIGRSALRAREIAIRGSLGASRHRVIGQFLVEALVLAGFGGAVGLAISVAAARFFQSTIPERSVPYWLHYGMDVRVFAALVLASLSTVMVFGLVPAIQASKTDVNRTLRDGGRSGTTRGGNRRLASAFLAAQFGLAIVLLAQGVISFQVRDSRVDTNESVDTPALLVANVTLPSAQYGTAAQRLSFYERMREQLQTVAGVSAVAIASQIPLGGGVEQRLEVEGRPRAEGEPAPPVLTLTIGPEYFATFRIPLRQGREFTGQDGRPGAAHAIVNERLAQRYFPEGNAIGRQLRLSAPNAPPAAASWLTIVGVASNIRQRNLLDPDPIVYLPLAASALPTASLIVRSSLDPAAAARRVREEVARLDPDLPLYRVMTMSQAIEEGSWNGRVSHNLILSITIIALALSMIGLYAVTAHFVGQRTQEIGIRMALGARPRQVRSLILTRAVVQVAIGLALGLMGSILWDSAFNNLGENRSGAVAFTLFSPTVIGPVALFLAALTAVSCLVPVRRATRVDPVAVLRHD
jgi:putative ABC transport system permease protein